MEASLVLYGSFKAYLGKFGYARHQEQTITAMYTQMNAILSKFAQFFGVTVTYYHTEL